MRIANFSEGSNACQGLRIGGVGAIIRQVGRVISFSPSGFGTFGARGVGGSGGRVLHCFKQTAGPGTMLPYSLFNNLYRENKENKEDGQRVGDQGEIRRRPGEDQGFLPLASIHSPGAKLRLLREMRNAGLKLAKPWRLMC